VKKVEGHRFNVPSVAQGGKDAPGVGGTPVVCTVGPIQVSYPA